MTLYNASPGDRPFATPTCHPSATPPFYRVLRAGVKVLQREYEIFATRASGTRNSAFGVSRRAGECSPFVSGNRFAHGSARHTHGRSLRAARHVPLSPTTRRTHVSWPCDTLPIPFMYVYLVACLLTSKCPANFGVSPCQSRGSAVKRDVPAAGAAGGSSCFVVVDVPSAQAEARCAEFKS